jgi:hypothetical protein
MSFLRSGSVPNSPAGVAISVSGFTMNGPDFLANVLIGVFIATVVVAVLTGVI